MTLFILDARAHLSRYVDLVPADARICAVYSTLDLAINAGREFCAERVQQLYDESEYKSMDLSVDDFISDKVVEASFCVTEIDPEIADNYAELCKDKSEQEYPPHHIEWDFDISNNFERPYRRIVDALLGYEMYLEDDRPEAGTLFKKGELVVAPTREKNRIYIVADVPLRRERYWENIYCLHYIDECGCYGWGMHDHIHERELAHYDGQAPQGLQFLAKILKGEIELSDELRSKVDNGEINFSDKPSWHDICGDIS
jgi:hypothetical protein